MRNYTNSKIDLVSRRHMWGSGGDGGYGAKNAERERKGIQLADETLKKQDTNAREWAKKIEDAAEQSWTRFSDALRTSFTQAEAYESGYRSDVGALTSAYDTLTQNIFDGLSQNIKDYETRSANISTRSADEAWNWNKSKSQEFIDFADTLSQAAFNTRQKFIADLNPYQNAIQLQAGKNNLDMLSGMLPADVLAATQRASAQQAVQGGFGGGSAMGQASMLRNLGLTSLDAMQAADTSSQNWLKTIYDTQIAGLQIDPSKVYDDMGLKTSDVLAVNQQNNVGILAAQEGLAKSRFSAADTQFNAKNTLFSDIYKNNSALNMTALSENRAAAYNTGQIKASGYTNASQLIGTGISQWGDQRQTINNTGWQNDLQIIADKNKERANVVTGITSAIGGIAGLALTGGNPMGMAAGASLGAQVPGMFGYSAGPTSVGRINYANSSPSGSAGWGMTPNTASSLSKAWDTFTGLTGFSTFGTETFGTKNALDSATAKGGYSSASYLPSMGGWVPKPTITGYR